MKVAVIQFPGSAYQDFIYAFGEVLGLEAFPVWHEEEDLKNPDLVVVPGGFSFGDYLRPGGLAKGSVIGGPLRRFAKDGGMMLGIGNGFQILCELGILPGAFLPNPTLDFCNELVHVVLESNKHPILRDLPNGKVFHLPLACYSGRYFIDQRSLNELESGGLIAFRYSDKDGECDFEKNFNGSTRSIAGIINRGENVLGLMVHPERVIEALTGNADGRDLLAGLTAPIKAS